MITDGATRYSPLARRLIAGQLLVGIGNGLVIPIWFLFLDQVRGFGPGVAGMSFALRAVALIAVAPIAGWVMDHRGTRSVFLAGTVLTLFGAIGMGMFRSPVPVLLSSLAMGAGIACTTPATRGILLQSVPLSWRSRAATTSFMMWNLGLGTGSLLGGLIADPMHPVTFELLFISLAALGVLTKVIYIPAMPKRRAAEPPSAGCDKAPFTLQPAFLCYLALAGLLQLVGYGQANSGLPGMATTVLGVSPKIIGFALAVNTAVILLTSPFTRRMARGNPAWSLGAVGLLWAAGWALVEVGALTGRTDLIVVTIFGFYALFGIGEVMLAASASPLVADLAPSGGLGRYLGIDMFIRQLGMALGPLTSAVFIAQAWVHPYFALSAGVCLLAAIFALPLSRLVVGDSEPVPTGKDGADVRPSTRS
ncbi:MFS transporter [Nocardia sp. NBC_01499]|uniref:MFS transporter n=1 Tax=Nocardia sp. NBC_01499 TaxID=2903597 RepID=UPI00386A38F3